MEYPKYNNNNMYSSYANNNSDNSTKPTQQSEENKKVCESNCNCAKKKEVENMLCSNINQSYTNDLECVSNTYSMSWPTNPELATAYVAFQSINKLYTPSQALKNGTIFPELVK